jgi:peptidoglycan hydrolase CwlO-like protein
MVKHRSSSPHVEVIDLTKPAAKSAPEAGGQHSLKDDTVIKCLHRDLAAKNKQCEELNNELQDYKFQVEDLEDQIESLEDQIESNSGDDATKVLLTHALSKISDLNRQIESLHGKVGESMKREQLKDAQIAETKTALSQLKTYSAQEVQRIGARYTELLETNAQLTRKLTVFKS